MGIPLEVTIEKLTGCSLRDTTALSCYRETFIPIYNVCPHCKMEPVVHRFYTGEFLNESYHCPLHGLITPIRSAIKN